MLPSLFYTARPYVFTFGTNLLSGPSRGRRSPMNARVILASAVTSRAWGKVVAAVPAVDAAASPRAAADAAARVAAGPTATAAKRRERRGRRWRGRGRFCGGLIGGDTCASACTTRDAPVPTPRSQKVRGLGEGPGRALGRGRGSAGIAEEQRRRVSLAGAYLFRRRCGGGRRRGTRRTQIAAARPRLRAAGKERLQLDRRGVNELM